MTNDLSLSKKLLRNPKKVKTGRNLAESSEGCFPNHEELLLLLILYYLDAVLAYK
jgi:hypothetical protein